MGLLCTGQLFSMFFWENFAVLTLDISDVISYAFWEDLLVLLIISSMLLFIIYVCTCTYVLDNKACVCKTVRNCAIQLVKLCTGLFRQPCSIDSHIAFLIYMNVQSLMLFTTFMNNIIIHEHCSHNNAAVSVTSTCLLQLTDKHSKYEH